MYSNRFQHSHGHSRQHSDKSSRQWDGYDDRWEERREPHRETQRNSHHKYGQDAHSSTERRSRSREYSDSPIGLYSRDSLNRDWSRKSPVRRRTSSPNWGSSGKKRQRFAESDKDDYRYRHVPKDKSPDSYSHARVSKDFKNTVTKEDDFKYRKTTQDSRHRYRHEEFTHRQQHDDLTCRRSSGYYRDGGGRERSLERSPERTRSRECFTKVGYDDSCVLMSVLETYVYFSYSLLKYWSISNRVMPNPERGTAALQQIIGKIEQSLR